MTLVFGSSAPSPPDIAAVLLGGDLPDAAKRGGIAELDRAGRDHLPLPGMTLHACAGQLHAPTRA